MSEISQISQNAHTMQTAQNMQTQNAVNTLNMDYHQSKLTKNEWISIEKPVDHKEKTIL
jgi:hypothetical protein